MLFSVEHCKAMIEEYKTAEIAAISGAEYRIGKRMLRRQDLDEIRKGLNYWMLELEKAEKIGTRGRKRIAKRVIPRDL